MTTSAPHDSAAPPYNGSGEVGPADEVVTLESWPEHLLGVSPLDVFGTEIVASIEAGPWLSWDGRTGAVGSIGVLFDDVLGYAIARNRPEGKSSVTTEMTIDVFAPLSVAGGRVVAKALRVQRDDRGGFASAELRSAEGDLIAVATQRGRFVSAHRNPPPDALSAEHVDRSGGLGSLLWPDGDRPGADRDGLLSIPVGHRFVNPLGNLHGGMSLLLAEAVAQYTARLDGGDLNTASIHMAYLRPIPAGTTITFEATVIHGGRTSGAVHVVGRTEAGKPGVIATVMLN